MIDKVDFKKTLDAYKAKRDQFRIIELPEMQYLAVDGHGNPGTSPAFTAAVVALYPVAYKVKFASKVELGRDYVVPPLEGLWWAEDMDAFTVARDKSQWDWTLLVMVPDWIDPALVDAAVEQVGVKDPPARLADLRLQSLDEGRCVQALHIGPFDAEGDLLEALHHQFIPDNGLQMAGTHHEIYLSDIRRVAPEKQRTILRQPVSATALSDRRSALAPQPDPAPG